MTEQLRPDLKIISEWIQPNTRILDLGCGDGTLLDYLYRTRNVTGYGLEIDDANIVACLERDITVIQTDLDAGLSAFFDNDSFDYVVMTETLQAIYDPARLLDEMLRVAKEGIITFLNMGYWQNRVQMALRGIMPMTRALPNQWYNTPNIRLCSIRDFEELCRSKNIKILQRTALDHAHRAKFGISAFPNLLAEIALYRFCRNPA